MNNIRKYSKKFIREFKGKIEYTALCEYVSTKGFLLAELHTKSGDELLRKYGCYDECASKNGMTLLRGNAQIVSINSELPINDKKYVLLHEIGHILIHFANTDMFKNSSVFQRENEAETFAYEVFRLQKYKFLYNRFVQIVAVCVLIIITALAGIQLSYGAAKPQQSIRAETYATETPVASASPAEELQINTEANVYTLPGSEVYHKDTCYHLNINNASALTILEAEKLGLRPCKDCDPE